MSLNVCTDQLAMQLAAPGQLVSVSFLASDPDLSAMAEQAARYPKNRGMAEEVFLRHPDLAVTGTYSLHNTTALLKRLGFDVAAFPYSQSVATIPDEVRRMGRLLGREAKAEQVASAFEDEVEEIESRACGPAPTALAYDQNGVAQAAGTLTDSVLKAAGFRNLAAELGYRGVTPFPLELVVAHKPDVIIIPRQISGAPSLADRIPRHPAIAALSDVRVGSFVPRGSLSCGTPSVITAMRALARLRAEMAPCASR
jgi:iron complex transport system substrate-binding protein